MIKIGISIGYKDIFDGKIPDIKEVLKGISREVLLKAMVFLIKDENKLNPLNGELDFIDIFFCENNLEIKESIKRKCHEIVLKTNNKNIAFLNTYFSLKLYEFCFDNMQENRTTVSNEEAEIKIFKAYLVIAQEFKDKEKTLSEDLKNSNYTQSAAIILFSQAFPYSELINYNMEKTFICQYIRSKYFFRFLEKNNPKLLILFLKYYKLDSWKKSLQILVPIIMKIALDNRATELCISKEEEGYDFISKISLSKEKEVEDIDFKTLRAFPFNKIESGFQVVNDLFLVELLHKGLFFIIKRFNDSLEDGKRDFRSYYCDNFSERYLLYKLLNKIYGKKSYKQISGDGFRENRINAEPDYYIRNGKNILLFESKDIMINASVKNSFSWTEYEKVIKDKLYYKIKNERVKPKAILQLINNISRILKKELFVDIGYKESTVKIYPILILFDNQFNIAGFNDIIDSWYKKELIKLEENGHNICNVESLTIIDIDTLIYYQDMITNGKIKLWDIIAKYHVMRRKKTTSRIELEAKLLSFSDYITKQYPKVETIKILKPELYDLLK